MKRAVYAGVVPVVRQEMEAMHKHRKGDANEEEDNGESDVNDNLEGFEVLGKVIVIVAHARLDPSRKRRLVVFPVIVSPALSGLVTPALLEPKLLYTLLSPNARRSGIARS